MNDQFTIHPFDKRASHYAAAVSIGNRIYPNYPDSIAEMQRSDRLRLPDRFLHRILVHDAASDSFVAFASASHSDDTHHPQKFELDVLVLPDYQHRGIGTLAYENLLDAIAPFNPIKLEAHTDSSQLQGIDFLEKRGYALATREYTAKLDLNRFDPTRFASYVDQARGHGIELLTLAQLSQRFEHGYERPLYELLNEIDQDVPWHDEIQPLPFDHWLKRHHDSPERMTDGYLVALDGDQMVGVTMLFKSAGTTDLLFTGLTGVKRTHRRKAIAMALKVQSLSWAKENLRASDGTAPSVMTENEENNPMFHINEKFGFVRQPDFLSYVKTIAVENEG